MVAPPRLSCIRRLGISSAAAVFALTAACGGGGGQASNGTEQLTVSYSETVADELPLWIAADAGYFKQQGLDVKLTEITGKDGVPALLSNQVQFASIGGSEVLAAVANGADLKYLATISPTYAYEMWAQPQFATANALRGQSVGITSNSGSLYFGTTIALQTMGLSRNDVRMTPLGSVTNVNNALLSGNIAAAAAHPPATTEFEKKGLTRVVDLAEKKVPAALVGIATSSSYAKSHPEVAQKLITALHQAIQREKTDKAFTMQEIQKYLKVNDPQAVEETYSYYANEVVPDVPTPDVVQFQGSKDELTTTNSKVAGVDLSKLVDPTFVNKAAATGPK